MEDILDYIGKQLKEKEYLRYKIEGYILCLLETKKHLEEILKGPEKKQIYSEEEKKKIEEIIKKNPKKTPEKYKV